MAGAISEERAIHRKSLSRMKKDDALAWNGKIQWAALTNKYFIVGVAPQGSPPVELTMRRQPDGSALGLEITVPHLRGAAAGAALAVYAGPQDQHLLAASPIRLQDAIEYGWKIIQPLSLLLLKCLRLLYQTRRRWRSTRSTASTRWAAASRSCCRCRCSSPCTTCCGGRSS
jgi:YidC/Oxa1 family membrane protein insertase